MKMSDFFKNKLLFFCNFILCEIHILQSNINSTVIIDTDFCVILHVNYGIKKKIQSRVLNIYSIIFNYSTLFSSSPFSKIDFETSRRIVSTSFLIYDSTFSKSSNKNIINNI